MPEERSPRLAQSSIERYIGVVSRPFLKMNGLGNDFVVVEARSAPFAPTVAEARALADRTNGIGCDQIIAIEPSLGSDAFMRIWNADGGEVAACGNGARCVGWLLMRASGKDEARIETAERILEVRRAGENAVTVDMGAPGLDWREIPLSEAMDTRGIELQVGPIDAPVLHTPGCVSFGNPHVVFFVPNAEAAPVAQVGSMIEHHSLFPDRANVGFAQVRSGDNIRLRVWERGVGVTSACGTAACAAAVAAHRRGLARRAVTVELDGGELEVEWRADGHVLMTGPVALEFAGRLPDGVRA